MSFFKNIQDSEFETGFLDYMSRFSQHIGMPDSIDDIWGAIIEHGVVGFISAENPQYNRTLYCALLLDFELSRGKVADRDILVNAMGGYDFDDYIYNNPLGVFSDLSGYGISALYVSLSINPGPAGHKMAKLMYAELRAYERPHIDVAGCVDSIESLLCASARGVLKDNYNIGDLADNGAVIPDCIMAGASEGFLDMSLVDQASIIEEMVSYSMRKSVSVSNVLIKRESYLDSILRRWPAEIIASRLIAGHSHLDVIPKVEQLIDAILISHPLKKDQSDLTKRALIKKALFPFPVALRHYAGTGDIRELLVFDESETESLTFDVSENFTKDTFGFLSKIGLSFVNSGHVILNRLNDYGILDAAIDHGLLPNSRQFVTSALRFTMDHEERILLKIARDWIHNCVSSVRHFRVVSSAQPSLYFSDNPEYLVELNQYVCKYLSSNIVSHLKSAEKAAFKIITPTPASRKDFIEFAIKNDYVGNAAIMQAAGLTQDELIPYWNSMSAEARKRVLTSEFGI